MFVGPSAVSWFDGRDYCIRIGGRLVIPSNEDEFNNTAEYCWESSPDADADADADDDDDDDDDEIETKRCWIGLKLTEGVWTDSNELIIADIYGIDSDGLPINGTSPWFTVYPNSQQDNDCMVLWTSLEKSGYKDWECDGVDYYAVSVCQYGISYDMILYFYYIITI